MPSAVLPFAAMPSAVSPFAAMPSAVSPFAAMPSAVLPSYAGYGKAEATLSVLFAISMSVVAELGPPPTLERIAVESAAVESCASLPSVPLASAMQMSAVTHSFEIGESELWPVAIESLAVIMAAVESYAVITAAGDPVSMGSVSSTEDVLISITSATVIGGHSIVSMGAVGGSGVDSTAIVTSSSIDSVRFTTVGLFSNKDEGVAALVCARAVEVELGVLMAAVTPVDLSIPAVLSWLAGDASSTSVYISSSV
jgi:hypothetical protein